MIGKMFGRFLGSSFSGWLAIGLIAAAVSFGGAIYMGFIRLADDRCTGLEAQRRIEVLQKENASLRANLEKTEAIKEEVSNVQDSELDDRLRDLGIMRGREAR